VWSRGKQNDLFYFWFGINTNALYRIKAKVMKINIILKTFGKKMLSLRLQIFCLGGVSLHNHFPAIFPMVKMAK
jgi:hypothetical protein